MLGSVIGADRLPVWTAPALYVVGSILFAVLGFIFSQAIIDFVRKVVLGTVRKLLQIPLSDLIFGILGLLIGLLIAAIICRLFDNLPPFVSIPISVVIYVFFGSIGILIGARRWHELPSSVTRHLHRPRRRDRAEEAEEDPEAGTREEKPTETGKNPGITKPVPKILDTSVIIDGRIYDVCKTGFMEGPLVIADFMLRELRHIADASDTIKRNRGRRGLEVLENLKNLNIEMQIDPTDFEDTEEVDMKLLRLAKLRGGCIVTNDYNLNKVAEVSGIPVLNINDLANALKPVAMAGEEMQVAVIREGKEANQGIGYLNDGTMIVIENGRTLIGSAVTVVVTSVLQTSAGRMIFAKVKEEES
ncbi:MAG: TRAM domain-containing protein [Clostridia bacterium]|nr:TRAM domain-containing protein [Clostridia bacterium]